VPSRIWIIPFRILQSWRLWVLCPWARRRSNFTTLYGLFSWLYASTYPRLRASFYFCLYGHFSTVWQRVACYDAIVSLFLQKLLLRGHNVRYKV